MLGAHLCYVGSENNAPEEIEVEVSSPGAERLVCILNACSYELARWCLTPG